MALDDHRWSGWPGAYCVDCGQEDQAELCMAVHDRLDFKCRRCSNSWPQGQCAMGGEHDVETIPCPEHVPTECPSPGSNERYN